MTILGTLRRLVGFGQADQSKPSLPETAASPGIDLGAEHRKWIALGDEGRFFEAINLCLATVSDPDENFLASSFLGYAYFQTTKYDLAIKHLEIALKKNPGDYYAAFFLANGLKAVGRKQESLAWFTACFRNHSSHAEEICDAAMQTALEIPETEESTSFFREFQAAAEADLVSSRQVERFLFFQGRDAELLEKLNDDANIDSTRVEFRRIRSVADWAARGHGLIRPLGAAEVIHFVTPPANGQTAHQQILVEANEPYVAEIPDASIVGGSSLIFAEQDVVLSDLLADKRYGRYASLQYDKSVAAQRRDALLTRSVDAGERIAEGIMLSGLASECYGHWFAEFLPRLLHLEQHPRFAEIPIIVDEAMPASHYDFLRALVANPLHIVARGAALEVGTLIVAPTMTFFPVELFADHAVPAEHQASWTVGALRYIGDRIRARFGECANASGRIFLSRKNSTWRRLLNEQEILDDLQLLGFRAVYLEECSFEEQVRIFQGAGFVVAPNGSALNSLVFARPDVKSLIIGQRNHFNWGGWLGPMMDLGYSPVFLSGEPVGDEGNKHSDYEIPIAEVRQTILKMLER